MKNKSNTTQVPRETNADKYGTPMRWRPHPLAHALMGERIKKFGGKKPDILNFCIYRVLLLDESLEIPQMSPAKEKALLTFIDQIWRETEDLAQVKKAIVEDFLQGEARKTK